MARYRHDSRQNGRKAPPKGPKGKESRATLHVTMVTIGDVLGIVAFFLGLGGTGWAMTVAMGLLFPEQTARASGATKGAFARGLVPVFVGFGGVVMLSLPLPLFKLVGWVVLLAVLALASLGLAGLSRVVGRRVALLQPEMGEYPAFLRGAGFLVAACLFPVLGWMLFAPVALVVSLGAGWSGVARRAASAMEA